MTRDPHKALNTREAVRGRLNLTGSKRRDAIERSRNRGELPSYTDDELEEITGQFAAISAKAAAEATANALSRHRRETPVKVKHESASVPERVFRYVVEHPAQVAATIASVGAALTAFGHWVVGLF